MAHLILGIESSCDETGVALCDGEGRLLAHALHTQAAMHEEYGGVVPELASRDHIRRLVPLTEQVLGKAGATRQDLLAVAYTAGPGLAGALLVGASFACALAAALRLPAWPIHHLEAHLLSPLLATASESGRTGFVALRASNELGCAGKDRSLPRTEFPFVALLVSGGHTQLIRVAGIGRYELLGETVDDAAGEAFDKTAKLLDLGYPGGPALAALAERGRPGVFALPRPMLRSGDFDFSFSGLKTAVLTQLRRQPLDEQARADLAYEFQEAVTEVLAAKALAAARTAGVRDLVVAGGVGANRRLRARLAEGAMHQKLRVHHPPLELCTDNGAMIAHAAALRRQAGLLAVTTGDGAFDIRPRWSLTEVASAQ